eukprot:XP_011662194.1 PREDICTED: cysteine-rich secretory protein 2-like [Strongylocentrotus purpuratus]
MAEDLTEQGLTDDEKSEILAKHNQYRSEVQPPAANMLPLQWNDEIAKMSQSWTKRCDLTLKGPSSTEWTACRLGRSVSFVPKTKHFLDFLDKWNNVTEDYNFEDNTCADICYRYTQMVRATTSFVGCGLAECFGGKLFYCMYGPSGDETKRPYESGLPCSSCPDSEGVTYSCENNLCTMG